MQRRLGELDDDLGRIERALTYVATKRRARRASTAVILRALERDDAPACDRYHRRTSDFFGLESGVEASAEAVRSEPGYVAVEDDSVVGFLTVDSVPWVCRDLVDGRGRAHPPLLVVMTSGDSVEYEPRGFYVARLSSHEDVSRLVGERPASPSGPTSVASATPMSMPFFLPADDPGPSFSNLLQRMGHYPLPDPGVAVPVTHATTCVAMRFAEGVVMAGDRRATSGNLISHRAIEKVFPPIATRHAIAGAGGPAMEMVKLFQLQLEHHGKVEGGELSLDGKAEPTQQMARSNLPRCKDSWWCRSSRGSTCAETWGACSPTT